MADLIITLPEPTEKDIVAALLRLADQHQAQLPTTFEEAIEYSLWQDIQRFLEMGLEPPDDAEILDATLRKEK
jgi:hypothetical protein